MTGAGQARDHRRRPLVGRDPDEAHRFATPLELLYDLTFVVSTLRAVELPRCLLDG